VNYIGRDSIIKFIFSVFKQKKAHADKLRELIECKALIVRKLKTYFNRFRPDIELRYTQ